MGAPADWAEAPAQHRPHDLWVELKQSAHTELNTAHTERLVPLAPQLGSSQAAAQRKPLVEEALLTGVRTDTVPHQK